MLCAAPKSVMELVSYQRELVWQLQLSTSALQSPNRPWLRNYSQTDAFPEAKSDRKVQDDGGWDKEVSKRIQKRWSALQRIIGVLCNRKLPTKLTSRLYTIMVQAAMLYGMEKIKIKTKLWRMEHESQREKGYVPKWIRRMVVSQSKRED